MIHISLALSILFYHNVPKKLTEEDKIALDLILADVPKEKPLEICAQIEYIRHVQSVVQTNKKLNKIPQYQTREPQDYLSNGGGICYDRSRTLEKALNYRGFQTRHLSVFYKRTGKIDWKLISQKDALSHALTEVKTKEGWLLLGTNVNWIAADVSCKVHSTKNIKSLNNNLSENFPESIGKYENQIVYGLYSRHGKFYPPYNFIPDYNLSELLYNLIE